MSRCICIAVTTGERCKRIALSGINFCKQHSIKCIATINDASTSMIPMKKPSPPKMTSSSSSSSSSVSQVPVNAGKKENQVRQQSPKKDQGKEKLSIPLLGKPVGIAGKDYKVNSSKAPTLKSPGKTSPKMESLERFRSESEKLLPCDKIGKKADNGMITPSSGSVSSKEIDSPLFLTTLNTKEVTARYGMRGEVLGEGTYGKVTQIGHKYALKQMKYKDALEGIGPATIREVSTFVYLGTFPNILNVYNVNIDPINKSVDLLTEFADQGDLKHFMTVGKMTGIDTLLFKSLVYQLVRGIAYMNILDVIHRDIKPQNCLLFTCDRSINKNAHDAKNPYKYILKIADLGLARSQVCGMSLTLTNPVYTLWYRSPEILLGSMSYDDKSDAWAVGATIYEMATGNPLFPADSEFEEFRVICRKIGPPSEEIWNGAYKSLQYSNDWQKYVQKYTPDYSDETLFPPGHMSSDGNSSATLLANLINKCLIYDPAKRWSSSQLLKHPYFDSIRMILEGGPSPLSCVHSPLNIEDIACIVKKCLMRRIYPIPEPGSSLASLNNVDTINGIVKFFSDLSDDKILSKTGHLAFFIYFNYIASNPVIAFSSEGDSRMISAASYYIASKLNDRFIVRIDKLAKEYSQQKEVVYVESKILKEIRFDLYASTSYDFMADYIYEMSSKGLLDLIGISDSSQFQRECAKNLGASIPLGFAYNQDLIALASIRLAMQGMLGMQDMPGMQGMQGIPQVSRMEEGSKQSDEALRPLLTVMRANLELLKNS